MNQATHQNTAYLTRLERLLVFIQERAKVDPNDHTDCEILLQEMASGVEGMSQEAQMILGNLANECEQQRQTLRALLGFLRYFASLEHEQMPNTDVMPGLYWILDQTYQQAATLQQVLDGDALPDPIGSRAVSGGNT